MKRTAAAPILRAVVPSLAAVAVVAVVAGCGDLRAGDAPGNPGGVGPVPGWVSPSAGLAVAGQQQQPATLLYAAAETTEVTAVLWDAGTGLGSISRTPVAAPHLPVQIPVTAPAGGTGPWVLRDRRRGQVVATLTPTPDQRSATLAWPGHGTEALTLMDDGKYEDLLALHARS